MHSIIFYTLAAATSAGPGPGTPVTLGRAWPAILAYGGWPEVDGTLVLQLVGVIAGGLFIWNQVQQARGANRPSQIQQPITIEHVKQFVTLPEFKEQIVRIDEQCEKLQDTVDDVLVNPEGYLHKSVHGVRNGLQAVVDAAGKTELRLVEKLETQSKELTKELATMSDKLGREMSARTGKAHDRVDKLAELQGQLVGKIDLLATATQEATRAAHAAALVAAEAKAAKGGRS